MNRTLPSLVALWVVSLLAVDQAQARVYKWIGPDGVVQYTQTPPPDGAVQEIEPPPPPTIDPKEAMDKLRSREEAVRKIRTERELDDGIAKQEAEMIAARQKNCRISRTNLKKLMDNPNGLMKLPDGSFRRITDQERQKRIDTAREGIRDYCE